MFKFDNLFISTVHFADRRSYFMRQYKENGSFFTLAVACSIASPADRLNE